MLTESVWRERADPQIRWWYDESVLHPIVLVALLVACILICVLPKKKVVVPVLFMAFLVPLGQQFYVAGVHLFVLRIVILIALMRAAQSRAQFRWNRIDTAFTLFVIAQTIAVMLLYGLAESVVNQVGFIWDFLGGYFLLRFLIVDEKDFQTIIKSLAVIMMLMAAAMTIEQVKQVNVFGLLGGVSAAPDIREGKLRSQGVFQHALTAGSFGASCLPLFFLLWKSGKQKILAVLGILAAFVVTVDTQTSTSLLTAMGAVIGIAFWPLRKRMRMIRRGLVAAIAGLALVMKAPDGSSLPTST